jgi:hypothetical protein
MDDSLIVFGDETPTFDIEMSALPDVRIGRASAP